MKFSFAQGEDGEETEDASEHTGKAVDGEGSSESEEKATHPLFDTGPAGDPTSERVPGEDLFVAEDDVPDSEKETVEGDKEPRMQVSTFKKRIGAIIRQREDAKREVAELEKQLGTATGERDALKDILVDLREKYKENPERAKWDATYMDALEELASRDPELQRLALKVQEHIEGTGTTGAKFTMADLATAKNEAETAMAQPTDKRLDALIEQQARTTIKQTLEGVKPAFQEILADHIVSQGGKLEGLTSADVVRISREYLTSKGLTQAEVLATSATKDAEPKDPKAKAKPATGGTSGSATAAKGAKTVSTEEAPEPAKSLEEFSKNREAQRERVLKELDFLD